jgi:glycosyltransferase involved in cell wall biosynthesis
MSNHKIKISVVITTYNRAELVLRAIESVVEQKSPADEILVIDDGSTDGTGAILQDKYPDISYLYQDNQGISAARNFGIKNAKYEWIAFLDSDDEWLPEKLERQRSALLNKPDYQICHTEEIWIRNGKRVNQMKKHKKFGGDIYKHCLPLCIMSPSSVLLHKNVFLEFGLFDLDIPACEDYDMWLRICAFKNVIFLDEPLIKKYGGHPDQLSHKYWGMDRFRIAALKKMIDKNQISEEKRQATIEMLLEKIRIFIIGAEKRGKSEDVKYYMEMSKKYKSMRG